MSFQEALFKKSTQRALLGAFLGLGAPFGWLMIRLIQGHYPYDELVNYPLLYLYMLVGTVFVFSVFGYFTGLSHMKSEWFATHDPLTGIYNRRYFQSRLNDEVNLSRRTQTPFSLIMMDLDHFKKVNDSYGHSVGDSLLCRFTDVLRTVLRQGDILARVGGEEFCVMLLHCDQSDAVRTAERFRSAVKTIQISLSESLPVSITCSFGVAVLTENSDANKIYNNADSALYQAKSNGRDCVAIHQDP